MRGEIVAREKEPRAIQKRQLLFWNLMCVFFQQCRDSTLATLTAMHVVTAAHSFSKVVKHTTFLEYVEYSELAKPRKAKLIFIFKILI